MADRRRVLIVAGSYAPTMIADMHRARLLAWCLPDLGWDVEILCPDAGYQPPACLDPDSAEFFAPDIPVHAVPPRLAPAFRAMRVGGIGPRALVPMALAGRTLLQQRRYDLVYLSTAQVLLFLLGPLWRRRFGIPFVLDLHDPILPDDTDPRAGLKHRLGRAVSRQVEATAVPSAAALIAVSQNYLDQLERRHAAADPAWLQPGRRAVVPFGFLPHDLEQVAQSAPQPDRAFGEIVYVGAGGPIMARSFALMCRALAQVRAQRPELLARIRISLQGTGNAHGEGDTHLAGIARAHGLGDVVDEDPARVTYRRSIERLLAADGTLILGVDDAGYVPSKLFTYAHAKRPILAALRRESPAAAALRAMPGLGHALWFADDAEIPPGEAAGIAAAFLEAVAARHRVDRDADLQPYSAHAMARRHAEVFEACLCGQATP